MKNTIKGGAYDDNYLSFLEIIRKDFPDLTDWQIERFYRLEALYRKWNQNINVISRKDIDNLYRHHVLHSLSIASYLSLHKKSLYQQLAASNNLKILDVGTGGGFPGIPLAILFPETSFTLCDSIGKKLIVVKDIVDKLQLSNVELVHSRVESINAQFDYIVSRAVTALDNFYSLVKGKCRGNIFYLKGGDIEEELTTFFKRSAIPRDRLSLWKMKERFEDPFFEEKFLLDISL